MSIRTGDAADDPKANSRTLTPTGGHYGLDYWEEQLEQAHERNKHFIKQGDRIIDRYLDHRRDRDVDRTAPGPNAARVNLFHANVKRLQDMLFDSMPEVEVIRTFQDQNDDQARVAATIMQRCINQDIKLNGDNYDSAFKGALQDRLLPGLGVTRVRYEMQEEEIEIPAQIDPMTGMEIPPRIETQLLWEDAPIDYFHWRDVRWGWTRTWAQLPWIAYRSYLTKDEVEERFATEEYPNVANELQYVNQTVNSKDTASDPTQNSKEQKAEIWEIWCKKTNKVYWIAKDGDRILDEKDDPLELPGFWPSPKFMVSNVTTSLFQPVADFVIAQDLYNEIDHLEARIMLITDSVRMIGIYPSENGDIPRLFAEGAENDLIPVDNWALAVEKGGLKGMIEWVPIEAAAMALKTLVEMRQDAMTLLYEVTGMSDIMRGQVSDPREGVEQTRMKGRFASISVQALKNEFSKFVTNTMQLKAYVIARHFEPQTIIRLSNIMRTPDAKLVPDAMQLIKDEFELQFRIKIESEGMVLEDQLERRAERGQYIQDLSVFLQSVKGMENNNPATFVLTMEILKWAIAGLRNSDQIESVLDEWIKGAAEGQAQAAKQPPPPNPEQIKAQAAMQAIQAKSQAELGKIQAKAQADAMARQAEIQGDMQIINAERMSDLQQIEAQLMSDIELIWAGAEADMAALQLDTQGNIAQIQLQTESEIRKDALSTIMEIKKLRAQTNAKNNSKTTNG